MADSRLPDTQNPYARGPRPDFGAESTFYRSIGTGLDSSLAGSAVRAGQYFLADAMDPDLISKQDFDKEFKIAGGPEWRQGMSRSRAGLMYDHFLQDQVAQYEINPRYTKSMLAGGFIGQAMDPTNYIGPAAASAGARMAGSASRSIAASGRGLQVFGKVINPEMFDVESKLATAGQRAIGRAGNVFSSGAMEGSLQTTGIATLSGYTQQKYGNEDALADYVGAIGISAVFGIGSATFRHTSRSRKDLIADIMLDGGINGVDKTEAVRSVLRTDPKMAAAMDAKAARAEKVKQGVPLSEQDVIDLANAGENVGGEFGNFMDRLEKTTKGDSTVVKGVDYTKQSAFPLDPSRIPEALSAHVQAYELERAKLSRNEANVLRRQTIEKNSQTAAERKAAGVMTDDEGWISDLYSRAFGVDVKFFDENVSKSTRALGFYGGTDPRTIYIRSGALMGGVDSMMSIAGHEVSHHISRQTPGVWLDMVDAIVATGAKNESVRAAYSRTRAALSKEGNSIWTAMPVGSQMDEMFATVSGSAMQTPEFWRSLGTNSPGSVTALRASLTQRWNAVKKFGGTKGAAMSAELGKILALADHEQRVPDMRGLDIKGGFAKYGVRHLDFMNAVAQDIHNVSYRDLLGKNADKSLTQMDSAIRELVTFQESGADLLDRSGSPVTRGQYDIKPFKFTAPKGKDWKNVVSYRILQLVFSKAKEGTPERAIFENWSKGTGAGSYEALQSYLKGERNSILRVIDHKDGQYSVGILRNDERPWITFTDETSTELEKMAREGLDDTFNRSDAFGEINRAQQVLVDMLHEVRDETNLVKRQKLSDWSEKYDPNRVDRVGDAMDDPLVREFWRSEELNDIIADWTRGTPENPDMIGPRIKFDLDQTVFDAILGSFQEFIAKRIERTLAYDKPGEYRMLVDHLDTIDVMQKLEPTGKMEWKKRKDFTPTLESFQKARAIEKARDYERSLKQLKDERDPATFLEESKRLLELRRQEMQDEISRLYVLSTQMDAALEGKVSPTDLKKAWTEIKERAPWIEQELLDSAQAEMGKHFPGYERVAGLAGKNDRFFDQQVKSWNDPKNEYLREKIEGGDNTDGNAHFDSDKSIDPESVHSEKEIEANEIAREEFDKHDGRYPPDSYYGMGGDPTDVYMARLADEEPSAAAMRAVNEAQRQEHLPVLALNDSARRIAEMGAREHAFYKGWTGEAYANTAFKEIARTAEGHGLKGFDPSADIMKMREARRAENAPKFDAKQQTMFDALMGIATDMSNEQGRLLLYSSGGPGSLKYKSTYAGERFDFHMRRLDRNPVLAEAAAKADILRESGSKMITLMSDQSALDRLQSLTQRGIEHVKNFLDGLAYKGTLATGDNLANSRIVARESAQGKLITLLEQIDREVPGFRDQWLKNQHTRNIELHRHGMYEGSPEVKKVYDRIIERLDQVNETLVGEANSHGANIRLIDRYLWSQVHRSERIRTAGMEQYISDLSKMLDKDATSKLHESGWEFRPWAEAFYNEVTDRTRELRGDFDPDAIGNNLADPEGLRRTIIFNPGSAFDYDMKYGSGHTAALITGQIGSRGEKIGLMRKMGTNYNKNWGNYISSMGGPGPAFSGLRTADLTYRHIAGQLDHPYDAKLATYGRAVRNWMNSAVGWMSGVSSMTDVGNLVAQLRFMDGDNALRYRSTMRSILSSMPSDAERVTWLRGNHAGLQSLVQSYSRVLESDGWFVRGAQQASDLTFKYNGLEVMNRSVQGAFVDISTQIFGENAHKPSDTFRHWLSSNGISDAQWAKMSEFAGKVDGLDEVRLSPDMITDVPLARQLSEAMRGGMDYALLQPSSSTEALLRMGTQAGTWTGEAVRSAMQFKAYPVDMVRRVVRRFNNGYAKNAFMERVIWGSTMIGLSVTAISIKDMLRGTEPLNPLDADQWNWYNVMRVAEGAAVGPFAMIGQFGSTEQTLGPSIGSAYGVFAADTAYGRTSAVLDMTPGSTAWTGPRRALMATVMPETFGGPIESMYAWRKEQTGQGRLFRKD